MLYACNRLICVQVLISRNYRGDIPMTAIEKFMQLILQAEEEELTVTPILNSEGVNFLYIRHNNLYLVALTKLNSNAAVILVFLHKLCQVFAQYFKQLEEESIRDNFVIIYELLDEMMDFGYPQTTESKILLEYANFFISFMASSRIRLTRVGTLPKSHTRWKCRSDHPWRSRTRLVGVPRA